MRRHFTLVLVLFSMSLVAQNTIKRIISPDDFAMWKIIKGPKISDNGKVMAYELNPERGDGQLIVKYLDSKQEDTIPRGYSASFSPESDFIVFKIKQPFDSIRKAKIDNIGKDKMPKDSLGIFIFRNRKIIKYPNLESYSIPEENAGWVAFLSKSEKDSIKSPEGSDAQGNEKEGGEDQKNDQLVLFNVETCDTIHYLNVTDFYYSKKGKSIAFIRETGDSLKSTTVSVFETDSQKTTAFFRSNGYSKLITTDDTGQQFAFLFSEDTIKEKAFRLYHGTLKGGLYNQHVDETTPGIPIGWLPSEHHKLNFSEDGSHLFFCTALKPKPEPKDTLPDDEKVNVDIWSWRDQELQPRQKVNLDKEKKRSYLAVLHLQDNKFVQLGDPVVREVRTTMKGNGQYALGKDIMPYRKASSWTGENKADYYLVDVKSGIKRKMLEGIENAWISPEGSFIVWYDPVGRNYYSRSTDIESQAINELTKEIPVAFYNELNDMPANPRPYGIAGWAENDRFVYIYDRYDIWKIDLTGTRVPVNITRGFGRRNQLRLRYVKLDPKEEFINAEDPDLVSSFDERSKSSGFFSVDFKNYKEPKLLLVEDVRFGTPVKAKNEDKLIFTKESPSEFPNLWASNMKFDRPKKISDANPQQKDYNWVFTTLIKWTSFSGEPLEGILYMPEDFSPRRKYPMIVYYYERNSDQLFRHFIPSPSRSVINRTFYASNGYLVFVPDITYRTGYPGQSAYNAVMSGVSYLLDNFSFIDRNNIGLQGQSWGGYQTAWLVTQTDMFAAAMAGAPVSNMTSAYGGIRWGSGMSRMFQYEHTQSRIGGTLWEKPMQYIENSPLFYVPKIRTPLLIMHNDNDGAVPWYQGIELFVALRRLNKPAWMLSYNGEPHNLKAESWGNRIDLSVRMKGFFDYYLQGKPMPEWMRFGIPAKDKGKTLGY